MGERGRKRSILSMAVALALLVPGSAAAATVVNGDFEAGTLKGWHLRHVTEAGSWFAYEGTEPPIGKKRSGAAPVQAPPQGAFAAIVDEANPDTLILYQDVDLEAGQNHRLSLLAYYDSYKPIAVPTPDTLSVADDALGGQKNQQFRIDVMKPGAPIESLDPADILRTVFQTNPGDPVKMAPTKLTADLTPFAGQTVRLRVAVAVHEEVLNAGVDAVSISSNPPGSSRGSDRLRLGKAVANPRNGTATLPVQVPGAGSIAAKGSAVSVAASLVGGGAGKRSGKPIKPASAKAAGAGTVKLRLKPTPFALAILKQKHRLRVRVAVTYKPNDGGREAASASVLLRLAARPHGH